VTRKTIIIEGGEAMDQGQDEKIDEVIDEVEVEILHFENDEVGRLSMAVVDRISSPIGDFVLTVTEEALEDLLAEGNEDVEVLALRERSDGTYAPLAEPEEMDFLITELEIRKRGMGASNGAASNQPGSLEVMGP
jgi:hypothetical protein